MKKTFFVLIAATVITHVSYGQWSTNGSNIYYNTGNVGIGTSSPASPLHLYSTDYTPILNIQSTSAGGESQMTFTGTSASFNVGVGNGTGSCFGSLKETTENA